MCPTMVSRDYRCGLGGGSVAAVRMVVGSTKAEFGEVVEGSSTWPACHDEKKIKHIEAQQ